MPAVAQQQPQAQRPSGPGGATTEANGGTTALRTSSYAAAQGMTRPKVNPWNLLNERQVRDAIEYNRDRRYTAAQVRRIQNTVKVPDDGDIGPITVKAVAKWQYEHGLDHDGMVGPSTWRAIRDAAPAPPQRQDQQNDTQPDAEPDPTPASGGLSANFSVSEFRCNDGTAVPARYMPNLRRLVRNLEVLRAAFGGASIHVNSGYRSPTYNRRVGGASNSQHLYAAAADIVVAGKTPRQVKAKIEELIRAGSMEDGGVGLYSSFVHYDVRGYHARW